MSNSFTNQTLARLDIWQNDYETGVYTLSKTLDEEVARLHLDKPGIKLTEMSPEQAEYIGGSPEGPYKPDHSSLIITGIDFLKKNGQDHRPEETTNWFFC